MVTLVESAGKVTRQSQREFSVVPFCRPWNPWGWRWAWGVRSVAWTLGRESCWGILVGKFGFPRAHHCTWKSILVTVNLKMMLSTNWPQLIKNKRGIDFASLLLVVGNDAANEVGVCVTKSDHQLGELLLVKLGHRPEHPFPGHTSELSVCHRLLCHAHNFSWKKTS